MSYDDSFNFDGNKSIFVDCTGVIPDTHLLGSEDISVEITNVFDGLEDDCCRSELSSISDSDSKYSEPSLKPLRKQLVIGTHIKIIEDRNHKYTCTICNCSFSRKQQVRYHDYCVTGKRPLKCELCGKGFIKRSHLTYHVRTHTGETPFKCSICNKGFKQKTKLTRHERTHESDSRLLCHFCKKSYSDKDSLRKHEQKHNEDVYKCPTCKKSYADKFTLKQHLLVHKSPNYICDVCGKPFLRKNSLNVHMQIHEDIYPFECGSCRRTFRNKKELKQHSITHDKDNPGHECEICSITCGRRDNLLRHIRNCHLDPCPKKSSNSHKDPCSRVTDLHEDTPLNFSNKVPSLSSNHESVTSKNKKNKDHSEKSTSQNSKINSEKRNLTDLNKTSDSDKIYLKLDKSSNKVVTQVIRDKAYSLLPQNGNEINIKENSHFSKEDNQNTGCNIQTILNKSIHNEFLPTTKPDIVKPFSAPDNISFEETSHCLVTRQRPEVFIKHDFLSSKADEIESLNYAFIQNGQKMYNKFNIMKNTTASETSVIKYTDAFKDVIIAANLRREPVIKNVRTSIVSENDTNPTEQKKLN